MLWKKSVGMYGRNGLIMIINVMVWIMILILCMGALYGVYMAIWECMMNFIRRINWLTLLVWVGLLMISFTIWYFLIKLIRSVL